MTKLQYNAQQLSSLLHKVQSSGKNATLRISSSLMPTRVSILVFQGGNITYVGSSIPDIETLVKSLVEQFNPNASETAFKFGQEKLADSRSARTFLQFFCQIRVLTWEQIESYFQKQAIIHLEQLLPHAGEIELSQSVNFDLTYGEDCHGLDLSKMQLEIARRQEQWSDLSPEIASMYAVPRINPAVLDSISDNKIRLHIENLMNGKRSILEIAEKISQDPLALANNYLNWAQNSWISFGETDKTLETKSLPMILSVDDSPIVQTMIKRALSEDYHVLLSSSAVDALNILNNRKISLLLLDVTMPDVDGLEMCRILRGIPKFRDLPIIMLTARDSLIDRMKGQIAGTNRYLFKPFDAAQLLDVIHEFI
jgi:CheY-like chemotaxis protein